MIELGDALVAQLGLEQSNDILGRWMAHHLARLIEEANAATGEQKNALEQQCFDAILAVWKHRNCMPQGYRPFEAAEPLFDTVAALDPEAPKPLYGRVLLQWDDLDEMDKPTENEARRFDVVRQFDRSARTVIQHLIGRAVEDLPDDTREWVRRAVGAGLKGPDIIVLRQLLSSVTPEEIEQQRLSVEIRKHRALLDELDMFLGIANQVREDIASRLEAAEGRSANPSMEA